MIWSKSERSRHYKTIVCHICKVDFKNGEKRASDHCHLTGKSNKQSLKIFLNTY